jgi:hypothetical protein
VVPQPTRTPDQIASSAHVRLGKNHTPSCLNHVDDLTETGARVHFLCSSSEVRIETWSKTYNSECRLRYAPASSYSCLGRRLHLQWETHAMTADHNEEDAAMSRDAAMRVIERAARLDNAKTGAISLEELRATASDVGLSSDAFSTAVREESAGLLAPREEKPLMVRLGSFGVPDRRSLSVMYWLFMTCSVLSPFILRLPWAPASRWSLFLGYVAFCAFNIWGTAKTIRWYDQHGWSRLWDGKPSEERD